LHVILTTVHPLGTRLNFACHPYNCASSRYTPELCMSSLQPSHQVVFGQPICLFPSTSN